MNSTFVTADTHYGHSNIASKNCSQWKEGYRCFDSLEEHNNTIVKNINKLVGEDDTLWHLGDWSFGGIQNIWNFRKQLRCRHIHLILGNHDDHIRTDKVLPNETTGWDIGVPTYAKSLFAAVQDVATIKVEGKTIFMSHYAHRIWYGSHKGVLHLYGHSHASLEHTPYGKSMDVGVDNAYKLLGEYRPFHINEVISILSNRSVEFCDHHSANTNIK